MKISSDHPSWAVNYLTEEQPKWDGWRNSLRPAREASHKLILANESKTDYVIVIPEQATLPERRSAEELRLWLGKITGASFPIVADAEPEQEKELSVGRTNRVTSDALARLPTRGAEGIRSRLRGKKCFCSAMVWPAPYTPPSLCWKRILGSAGISPAWREPTIGTIIPGP